jgi:hypothetical protein
MQMAGTNEGNKTDQQAQSAARGKLLQNPQLPRNRQGGEG